MREICMETNIKHMLFIGYSTGELVSHMRQNITYTCLF